jgi:ketosteroid isomerase-like protein
MTKMGIARAIIGGFAAASLAACNNTVEPTTPAADTGKIAAAVKADVDQLSNDFNAHDADRVAGHDAPDVVQMAHGGANTTGTAADLAANKQLFATDKIARVTLANTSVGVSAAGDMAVYRSTYVYTFTNPKTKAPDTESGNYLAGYKRQPSGAWRIEWSVLSNTPAPPAAKS